MTYNTEKKSRAVIANGPYGGAILWWVGIHLHMEMHEGGITALEDLGLDDAPNGISIWEGVFTYDYSYDGEADIALPHGKFRNPTEDEWPYIQSGYAPWNEDDWMIDEE